MIVLGIETSCDETAAAVVKDGRHILSNVIFSQIKLHAKTGGVVPEVAAREHTVKIAPVIREALEKAGIDWDKIDAIAATAGPGLLSSLLIGANAATAIAGVLQKPLVPVNHIEGHIYANWLCGGTDDRCPAPKFPIAVLTVSGGHNELLLWRGHGNYKFLGATLDDAAGEAFDKVGRLLGLPYPGGPAIQKAAAAGDGAKYNLPRAWVTNYNFSFSGLKTAMLRLVQSQKRLTKRFVADAAASFQESVCEVLATKLVNAAKEYRAAEIHLAGGVSANSRLREMVKKLAPEKTPVRFCTDFSLCTDNAAMIAAAGYYKYTHSPHFYKKFKPILPKPNLEMENW